jgi:hypothetical protein
MLNEVCDRASFRSFNVVSVAPVDANYLRALPATLETKSVCTKEVFKS